MNFTSVWKESLPLDLRVKVRDFYPENAP